MTASSPVEYGRGAYGTGGAEPAPDTGPRPGTGPRPDTGRQAGGDPLPGGGTGEPRAHEEAPADPRGRPGGRDLPGLLEKSGSPGRATQAGRPEGSDRTTPADPAAPAGRTRPGPADHADRTHRTHRPAPAGRPGGSEPVRHPYLAPGVESDDGEDRLPQPRFSMSGQTWKEIAHLLANLPLGVLAFCYVMVWLPAGVGLSITVIGLPLLAAGLMGSRLLGAFERHRVRALLSVRIERPSPLRQGVDGGFFPWLWSCLKDPVGWRATLYAFLRLPWGVVTFAITLVSLFVAWPVLPWIARGLTNVDRVMARGLLCPSDELERRIAQLESDRGVVVDTAAADLRRIERDLHDGAQARLVALAMGLGLAKEKLLEDPEAAAHMVDEAHGEVKLALQELRDLARGIHPAILTDRGLGPALSSVAARCTVPVQVIVDLEQRPAAAIEGIAYFTASELLQNISKHSGARTATVDLWRSEHRLMLQVTDDGRGGASTDGGSGLAGLAERLGSVDGLLVVDSPAGGPTVVTAELPWRDRVQDVPSDVPGDPGRRRRRRRR